MTELLKIPRRLVGSVRRKYFRSKHGDAKFAVRYWGADLYCTLGNSVTKGIAAGTYEWEQISIMTTWARNQRPDLFIDIGANIGLYCCILLRKKLVPAAIGFEPDHRNMVELKANADLNGIANQLQLQAYALSDHAGTAMFEEGPAENRGNSRFLSEGSTAPTYQVQVQRFDDLYNFTGKTLVIKIDVEGHEFPVLRGMERTLTSNHCFMQIESFSRAYEPWLAALGYRQTKRVRDDYYWSNDRARGLAALKTASA